MALTASALITAAKQRTFAKRGRQKISNAMLLEELSFQDQLVVQLVSQNSPDLLATVTGTLTCSNTGNTNGYTLSSGIHYRDFTHADINNNKYTPINIVGRVHRDVRPAAPAGMVRTAATAGVFYPVDPANKRWGGSDTRSYFNPDEGHLITYSYVPLPTTLTSLSSTLRSPDMAREVFVTSLEVSILLAQAPETEAELAAWQVQLQNASQRRQEVFSTFLMQAVKFAAPQGQPASADVVLTESEWVDEQVSG